jgi:hypothetical protein
VFRAIPTFGSAAVNEAYYADRRTSREAEAAAAHAKLLADHGYKEQTFDVRTLVCGCLRQPRTLGYSQHLASLHPAAAVQPPHTVTHHPPLTIQVQREDGLGLVIYGPGRSEAERRSG